MSAQNFPENVSESIVDRCRNGDFQAFRELIEHYQSRIFSVCYAILRNREDVRDVMQEVFMKMYNSFFQYHGRSAMYVWIYRIAVNTSLDYLRKIKRKWRLRERIEHDIDIHGSEQSAPTPEEYMLNIELKEIMRRAIHSLPDAAKSVIILREIEGLSYQEIAKVCQCSVGTVMSRLFYARKKLVKKLKKELILGEDRDDS